MKEEVYKIYHIDINPYLLTEVRRLNKNTESAMKRCFSYQKLDRD